MKKMFKLIIHLLAIVGLTSVIAWILGYSLVRIENAVIDNEGVIVVIQVLSLIALVGTVIYQVYNSNNIARDQNNIALFSKRLDKYNEIQQFIAKVMSDANCTNEEIISLKSKTRNLDLLFDDEIVLYVNILVRKGLELKLANNKYDKLLKSKGSVEKVVEEEYEILSWFSKQIEHECRDKFSKYLDM